MKAINFVGLTCEIQLNILEIILEMVFSKLPELTEKKRIKIVENISTELLSVVHYMDLGHSNSRESHNEKMHQWYIGQNRKEVHTRIFQCNKIICDPKGLLIGLAGFYLGKPICFTLLNINGLTPITAKQNLVELSNNSDTFIECKYQFQCNPVIYYCR